ncbi:hypothetical protein EYF80_055888 [Liparis tanakae]|uniref:Uncharacterized protein n=1 Tax=Liparis tanakae TaxID=230148 RepID=A0A4Z2EZX5_9TELE|nr:hypothetical protein EYF80_055888 [Liparis tanakae]
MEESLLGFQSNVTSGDPAVLCFPHRDVPALLSLLYLFTVLLLFVVEVQDVLDARMSGPDLEGVPVVHVP